MTFESVAREEIGRLEVAQTIFPSIEAKISDSVPQASIRIQPNPRIRDVFFQLAALPDEQVDLRLADAGIHLLQLFQPRNLQLQL